MFLQDVVLMQPLEAGTIYEFNLVILTLVIISAFFTQKNLLLCSSKWKFQEVTDTKGESTTVESKLQATEPLGPFVG